MENRTNRMSGTKARKSARDLKTEIKADCLIRLREAQREREWLTMQLEMLRAASTDTSAKITCAPGGGAQDKLGNLMALIDEAERKLKVIEAERQELIRTTMRLIARLQDRRMQRVMCEKTVLNKPLTEICE